MKPYPLECSYPTRQAYCDALYKIVELESFVESLKTLEYYNAQFEFDIKEQREITKRIIIDIIGKKNITDQTILALRIPYSKQGLMLKNHPKKLVSGTERLILSGIASPDHEESKEEVAQTNPEQENPNFYEAYGKVFSVKFHKKGIQVIVDINHRSPIDFE